MSTLSTSTANATADLMGYTPWIDPGDSTLGYWERGHLDSETVSAYVVRYPGDTAARYMVDVNLEEGTADDVRELVALLNDWLLSEIEAKPETGLNLPHTAEEAAAVGAVTLLHHVQVGRPDAPALCGETTEKGWSFKLAQELQAPGSKGVTATCRACEGIYRQLPATAGQEAR